MKLRRRKSPLTLTNELGESREFESGTAAAQFFGFTDVTRITRMKRNPALTREAEGHQWHCTSGKVETYKHRPCIIFRNLFSTDKEHPEEVINFNSEKEAIKWRSEHSFTIWNAEPNQIYRPDTWYFSFLDDEGTQELKGALLEDDGIINLDEADKRW